MIEEFVPYEIAIKLKELGFDEECIGAHTNFDDEIEFIYNKKPVKYSKIFTKKSPHCVAPTFSQVFRWFRINYDLDHQISYAGKKGEYHAFVNKYVYGNNGNSPSIFSYEDAELNCVYKLIEIVKQKR